MTYTVKELKERGLIIFDAIMGSRAYGTSLPTSDYDNRGVFIQPLKDILTYGYVEQVSEKNNDIIYYELKRFLTLVKNNNPNIIELLNAPEDMILTNTTYFQKIIENKHKFITTKCKTTFGGYAIAQIKKARGLKKKMNWNESAITRKTVLDFCYVLLDGKSMPFNEWKILNNKNIDDLGLAKIDHGRDLYGMYLLSPFHKGKRGIIKDVETSNDVQVVSFSKETPFITNMIFNKDAYSSHCKLYAEYNEWLKNRNEDRYKMNKEHGKNYDSKNMMHTFRLLHMATEIAETGYIRVRRTPEEVKVLMQIRRGEMEYENLIDEAEILLEKMDKMYELNPSNLPNTVDIKLISDLLYDIRNEFYNDKNKK